MGERNGVDFLFLYQISACLNFSKFDGARLCPSNRYIIMQTKCIIPNMTMVVSTITITITHQHITCSCPVSLKRNDIVSSETDENISILPSISTLAIFLIDTFFFLYIFPQVQENFCNSNLRNLEPKKHNFSQSDFIKIKNLIKI
jgi:cytosine/uracil/thiamine/allantoin permease